MIAAAVDPTRQGHFLTGMLGSQRSAVVCLIHGFSSMKKSPSAFASGDRMAFGMVSGSTDRKPSPGALKDYYYH
jgi:hypothetical protein